jgi:hypothetical protein
MSSLGDDIREYTTQLSKGQIQRAYKGIMAFMAELKAGLERKYPHFAVSALYFGYMDMTYFAFTPPELKKQRLKIAIVYLHEECRFELWLAASNRQTQAEYVALLSQRELGGFTLSPPGVDAIIAAPIDGQPDFGHIDELKAQIEAGTIAFAQDIVRVLAF